MKTKGVCSSPHSSLGAYMCNVATHSLGCQYSWMCADCGNCAACILLSGIAAVGLTAWFQQLPMPIVHNECTTGQSTLATSWALERFVFVTSRVVCVWLVACVVHALFIADWQHCQAGIPAKTIQHVILCSHCLQVDPCAMLLSGGLIYKQ